MATSFRLLSNRKLRAAAADHQTVLDQHASALNREVIPRVEALCGHAAQVQVLLTSPFMARLRWLLFGALPVPPKPEPEPAGVPWRVVEEFVASQPVEYLKTSTFARDTD